MRNLLRSVGLALACAILFSSAASAEGYITPFIGYNFSGDAGNCPGSLPCSTDQLTYGASTGFMVGGIFGIEGDFAYSPHFFGKDGGVGDNKVLTAMANVLLGIPAGPIRIYGVGGVGLMHTNLEASPIGIFNALSNNTFAYDLGGGIMGFFSSHVGIRGDLRFMQSFENLKFSESDIDLKDSKLHYGRATIGVTFRF